MRIIDDGLEILKWQTVNDKSVNSVPADSIFPQTVGNALELYMICSQQYGGALAHCPRAIPMVGGTILPYVGLDMEVSIPSAAMRFLRCLEIDLKVSAFAAPSGGTAANVCDFSSQIELFNKGNIQIDDASETWGDIGLSTGPLPTDTWFQWSGRYLIDSVNKKFSVLSLGVNGTTYDIPSTFQGYPWRTSNWGQSAEIQLQLDNDTTPSALMVKYRNISLTWCDKAF